MSQVVHATYSKMKRAFKPCAISLLSSSLSKYTYSPIILLVNGQNLDVCFYSSHIPKRDQSSLITKNQQNQFSSNKHIIKPGNVRLTLRQLLFVFPKGVKKLFKEIKAYYYDDESHKIFVPKTGDDRVIKTDATSSFDQNSQQLQKLLALSSQRQRTQQARKLVGDLKKVLVPVVGWAALPILGNLFLTLPLISPKDFLSRHFFTAEQYHSIIISDSSDRMLHYSKVAQDCFLTTMSQETKTVLSLCNEHYKLLGKSSPSISINDPNIHLKVEKQPLMKDLSTLLSFFALFYKFEKSNGQPFIFSKEIKTLFPSLLSLSESQLYSLAYANGILRDRTLSFSPPLFIVRSSLQSLALEIATDDLLLLREEEQMGSNVIENLSNEEILDACLFRGLPTNVTTDHMKISLSDYLKTIKELQKATGNKRIFIQSTSAQVFLLHLASIRHDLNK